MYETFESIQAVLNTDRDTHNLEIQYKYNTNTVYFLLYSIQVFFPKKYIDHRYMGIAPHYFVVCAGLFANHGVPGESGK